MANAYWKCNYCNEARYLLEKAKRYEPERAVKVEQRMAEVLKSESESALVKSAWKAGYFSFIKND